MTNKYHNLSIAELYARLDDFLSDDEIAVREGSRVIQAMYAKGEKPECSKIGTFKFWKAICDETLHPRAAIVYNAFPKIIEALMKLERDMQEALANGRSIDVAVINSAGVVEHKNLKIIQVPAKTLAVMAANKRIIPVKDQEAALLAAYKPKEKPAFTPVPVRANTGTNTITVGSAEIDAARLVEALRELGFTVTR